jgi:hypothetical protein
MQPTTTEMLFCLCNHSHVHVWAPCVVSPEDLAVDPETTPEEVGAVHCLRTYGMASGPVAVRDQHGKLVRR